MVILGENGSLCVKLINYVMWYKYIDFLPPCLEFVIILNAFNRLNHALKERTLNAHAHAPGARPEMFKWVGKVHVRKYSTNVQCTTLIKH